MSKIWLVAEYQFRKEVLKRGFLLAIIAMPLFLGFTAGMGWLGERMQQQTATLGYVDPGNVMGPEIASGDDQVRLVRFATGDEARAALDAGQDHQSCVLFGGPRGYDLGCPRGVPRAPGDLAEWFVQRGPIGL